MWELSGRSLLGVGSMEGDSLETVDGLWGLSIRSLSWVEFSGGLCLSPVAWQICVLWKICVLWELSRRPLSCGSCLEGIGLFSVGSMEGLWLGVASLEAMYLVVLWKVFA